MVEFDKIDDGSGCNGNFDRNVRFLRVKHDRPLLLMLRTSSSIDLSVGATQFAVDYDEVDNGGGKLVQKLWISRKIIKKPKKPQRSKKIAKTIGLEERLIKYWSSVNWIQRTWALFAGPRNSFDTMFEAIIVKTKLIELLMLYHVFSPKELLFTQHISSFRYFSSGIYPAHFNIKITREFVAHIFPSLKSGEAPQKDVPAKD